MDRYRITITCSGLTDKEGPLAPSFVLNEFAHRPWQENVQCRWDGNLLWLEAENNCDREGKALLDEYWDVVIACVPWRTQQGDDIPFVVATFVPASAMVLMPSPYQGTRLSRYNAVPEPVTYLIEEFLP